MFKPSNNRVLVRPEEIKTQTASGIILPDSKELPVKGTVVVGNKDINEGDKILFSKFGYDEVEIDTEKYYVVSDFNILGIF